MSPARTAGGTGMGSAVRGTSGENCDVMWHFSVTRCDLINFFPGARLRHLPGRGPRAQTALQGRAGSVDEPPEANVHHQAER
jgi:hypothetical protein